MQTRIDTVCERSNAIMQALEMLGYSPEESILPIALCLLILCEDKQSAIDTINSLP